jgi:excinuclease ABC subunit A
VKWHTHDRITTKGTPCKWDGAALLDVIEQVEALGEWGETNWTHRTIVEVVPEKKSKGWFLHAMTGHEAYLKLCFRVRRNEFKTPDLAAKLALRPLSDYAGHEGYSRDHRVEVTNDGRGPGQTVVVTLVKKEEAELPAFRAFVKQAVESFEKLTDTATVGKVVEAAMPWKIDGEKWHLGEKGFPPGKGAKWDRTLLPKLLQLLRDIEPGLKIQWDVKDAITVRVPGSNRFWVRIKTKESAALEVWLPTKPSQFNLAKWDGIGRDPTLEAGRWEGADVVTLRLITADHLNLKALRPLLLEQLRGFREMYAA